MNVSITRIPDDLWGGLYELVEFSPTCKPEQVSARKRLFRALQRGTCQELQDALAEYNIAYIRDINGKLIAKAKNALVQRAGELGRELEHWLADYRAGQRGSVAA